MKKEIIIKLRRTILIFWILLSTAVLVAVPYLGSVHTELQGILKKCVLIFIGISFAVGGINMYLTKKIRK